MTIYRPIIWTNDLRDGAAACATQNRNADVASRAREIWNGAKVGATLTPMQCEFVAAMRSRFGDARDPASVTAERAFENAWGDAWAEAAPAALPDHCYGVHPETGALVLLKAGETGYWPAEGYSLGAFATFGDLADMLNRRMGVTPGQRAAMEAGSVFGFDVPGADASRYDPETGRWRGYWRG